MKGLLKNLGVILIVIGGLIPVVCSYTGNVNNNTLWVVSAILIVVGLVSYIIINKKITD